MPQDFYSFMINLLPYLFKSFSAQVWVETDRRVRLENWLDQMVRQKKRLYLSTLGNIVRLASLLRTHWLAFRGFSSKVLNAHNTIVCQKRKWLERDTLSEESIDYTQACPVS